MTHYSERASSYNEHALVPGDEHFTALEYVTAIFGPLKIQRVLDFGCGTGRGCRFLQQRKPGMVVIGVDPVEPLLQQAKASDPISSYVQGDGFSLPFQDGAFDAVCATGVFHHLPNPDRVIQELLRVTTLAVFISDSNRFGQGSRLMRYTKFALYRLGMGRIVNAIQTRGRGSLYSEGDGQFYSYSVFDSLETLAKWADRVVAIGTAKAPSTSVLGPIFGSSHALLAAVREPDSGFAELWA